jgi:hypothetical protein
VDLDVARVARANSSLLDNVLTVLRQVAAA